MYVVYMQVYMYMYLDQYEINMRMFSQILSIVT